MTSFREHHGVRPTPTSTQNSVSQNTSWPTNSGTFTITWLLITHTGSWSHLHLYNQTLDIQAGRNGLCLIVPKRRWCIVSLVFGHCALPGISWPCLFCNYVFAQRFLFVCLFLQNKLPAVAPVSIYITRRGNFQEFCVLWLNAGIMYIYI